MSCLSTPAKSGDRRRIIKWLLFSRTIRGVTRRFEIVYIIQESDGERWIDLCFDEEEVLYDLADFPIGETKPAPSPEPSPYLGW